MNNQIFKITGKEEAKTGDNPKIIDEKAWSKLSNEIDKVKYEIVSCTIERIMDYTGIEYRAYLLVKM